MFTQACHPGGSVHCVGCGWLLIFRYNECDILSSNCSLVPSAPLPKYVNYLVMVLLKFCIKQIHNHMELKGQSSVLNEPISTAALFTLPNSPFTLPNSPFTLPNSPFTLHPLLYDTVFLLLQIPFCIGIQLGSSLMQRGVVASSQSVLRK